MGGEVVSAIIVLQLKNQAVVEAWFFGTVLTALAVGFNNAEAQPVKAEEEV